MSKHLPHMNIVRPQPILDDLEVVPVKRITDRAWAVEALLEGEYLLVDDFYSTGLDILAALKNRLKKVQKGLSYQGERAFRSQYQEVSQRLLVCIENRKLALSKAPTIGWIERLYPELTDFLLPFPQVQGLNSSWQWYCNGIQLPILQDPIHPYFGTYFPTRFDHLDLFSHWLKQYRGPRKTAVDVGTGCGVLALHLLQQGFETAYATDINPNAILSVEGERSTRKLEARLSLENVDLMGRYEGTTDLIIFNPPWLPGPTHSQLDKAIYYDEALFERFFTAARKHLTPESRLVFLFSNLLKSADTRASHPIEAELGEGSRFRLVERLERKVRPGSKKTRRSNKTRENERVELWSLALKN
ncbi:MAG: methyltransferase [Myxococcota bacterium]|nr:methyltransferase [Myxococcota bacterium]